jgi:PAS domain S-box-containing protein
MHHFSKALTTDPSLRFLMRDGEMRTRIREFDWRSTELGDPGCWSSSVKTAIAIMLDCAGPAYIAWGSSFVQMYNDAYIPILGELKHPVALGMTTAQTWAEIWDIVAPLFNKVVAYGDAISMENKLMPILRNGRLEECYFSFSYSPLTDEAGNVTGVLALPRETTREFVGNRRESAVRSLMHNLSDVEDMRDISAAFEKTVLDFRSDIPFGLLYEFNKDHGGLDLVAAAGIQRGSVLSPEFLDPERDVFYAGLRNIDPDAIEARPVDEALLRRMLPHRLIANPHTLFIKPLCYSNYQRADGYFILAANPMLPNDGSGRDFCNALRLPIENAMRRINKSQLERRDRMHEFQTVMSVLPCLVWMSDTSGACIFFNRTWLEFRGRSLEQEIGNGWIDGVHPDDMGQLGRGRHGFAQPGVVTLEYRLMHADGDYRWILDERSPRYDINGEFLGHIGTCIDITERKKAEQDILASQVELRTLYERLKTIREEERGALAREVHDQLGQLLSAAKIDIKLLEEDFKLSKGALSRGDVSTELRSARDTIDTAIQVVRRLATELRSPELGSQGLPSAIEWHARDFERRTRIPCSVELPREMPDLEHTHAIALFRIFQEAMTNIVRHAKATHVWVTVECRSDEIRLRVLDNGIGIPHERVRSARSIGLKGMRERAAIAGGKLMLGPAGQSGTVVVVTVPLRGNGNSVDDETHTSPGTGEIA